MIVQHIEFADLVRHIVDICEPMLPWLEGYHKKALPCNASTACCRVVVESVVNSSTFVALLHCRQRVARLVLGIRFAYVVACLARCCYLCYSARGPLQVVRVAGHGSATVLRVRPRA